jgi:hypothetical protein
VFGTLKPARAAFDCRTRGEWQRFYCGTCQGIGAQFGLGYRGLLSHDAVFLGLLVDGLQVEAAPPDRTRCPIVPVVHRPTVSPSSVAMRYSAAVQLLLADQWVADRAIDGRSLARCARPLLAKPANRARAMLAELGSDLAELIGIENRQAAAELLGVTGPDQAAEPTAAALELVFERIAKLPGVVAELHAPTLARLGRAVGTVIYLVDALEDLDRDRHAGDFNPCLTLDRRGRAQPSAGRIRRATAMLNHAGAEIRDALAALPLRRHAAVLQNILITQLGGRAKLASASAERVLSEDDQRRRLLARLAERSGARRFAQALFALAFTLVTGLWSRIVRAASETGGSESDSGTDTDTGGETGGEAVPTGPDLGAGTETGASGIDLDATSGSGCPCFSMIGELIKGCCGGLSDACGSLGESIGACGSCTEGCANGCSGCGQSCGEGCSSCGNCGNACSGCGDCGNACSGCGDCGNACSGCGSGCGNCGSDCGNCGNCGGGGCGNCGGGGGGCNC